MNTKKFVAASIAVFVIDQVAGYIVHRVLLHETYQMLIGVWREDMMSKMWVLMLTSLIFSFLFVYVFTKGYENKGVAEGLRYGLLIGLLMNVTGVFNQYAIYPVPLELAIKWFIFGMVQFIVYGAAAALIYRPKK